MASIVTAPADLRPANLARMMQLESYDYVIVCTGDAKQAEYWQRRLTRMNGQVFLGSKVLAVDESAWNGGAGNGFGTLFAFENACKKCQELYGEDLTARLREGASVSLYHTAGKGTRLAPLPGSEVNNKPGVQLPGVLMQQEQFNGNGTTYSYENISILEAVIKQTGVYATSRGGRLSVYWGDQIFIPSADASYIPTHEVDIMCTLREMPDAATWAAEGLDKYGLIAVNADGNAAQVEKVSHATATSLLSDGLGEVASVGTSLGSFSVSVRFLEAIMAEFAPELAKREGSRDTDPHFWMPLTLSRDSYLSIMAQKGVNADTAATNYDRMAGFRATFEAATGVGSGAAGEGKEDSCSVRMFGAVDIGRDTFWWDYGQLRLYNKFNKMMCRNNPEAEAMRGFFGVTPGRVVASEALTAEGSQVVIDEASCVVAWAGPTPPTQGGRVESSCLSRVFASQSLDVQDSLLVGVTAKKISAHGALCYNVVDTTDEGVVLTPGQCRCDVIIDGARQSLLCDTEHDGRVSWKLKVSGNSMTFEEVWKYNKTQDCVALLLKARNDNATAIRTMSEAGN